MSTGRDTVAEMLVEHLATAPALAAVQGRVQHGELATLPDPIYPLITFHREVATQDLNAPRNAQNLVVLPYSLIGLDEAWSLYQGIRDLLDHQVLTKDGVTAYFELMFGPVPDPIGTPTPVYRVISLYRTQQLNT